MSKAGECGVQIGEPRRSREFIPFILVVDADAEAREEMAALAREEGYIVIEAVDGAGALRALKVGGISLVVCDMQLNAPTDGLELLADIRDGWPGLPLIAVSEALLPFPGVLPTNAVFVGKPYR